MSRRARVAIALAAAFVAAAAAWALVQAVAAPEGDEDAAVAGAPSAVVIEVDQGDVTVRAVPGTTGARARARVRTVVPPERTAALVDGEARLSWTCRLWTTCRADVTATVPAGVPLTVRTDFGDVRVDGPAGDLDLRTGSGEVTARGVAGRAAEVRARSGDVSLRMASRPFDVDVETSSGDIDIAVPAGAYRIEAETRAGQVSLRGVRDAPAAPGAIRADTTAGDVTVRAAGPP